jgi:hypothetical protein
MINLFFIKPIGLKEFNPKKKSSASDDFLNLELMFVLNFVSLGNQSS